MRAVKVFDGQVGVVDVPDPAGDGVMVWVKSSGICGSDLHLVPWSPTAVLGHEFAGELIDHTRVAVQPTVPCGSCDQCTRGASHLCRTLMARIYGVSLDGGLAERVLVDPSCIVLLPATLDTASAVLVEPTAISVHAANRCEIAAGERVLVVGAGTIGVLTAAALVAHGAQVDVVARHHAQEVAVEAVGARPTTEGEYEAVVDAAGTQSSLDTAIERVAPGGRVVAVGTYWDPVSIGIALLAKEAQLVPAYGYGHASGRREVELAVDLLAANPAIAGAVITHRFALHEATEAFRVAADRSAGAIKVVLHP